MVWERDTRDRQPICIEARRGVQEAVHATECEQGRGRQHEAAGNLDRDENTAARSTPANPLAFRGPRHRMRPADGEEDGQERGNKDCARTHNSGEDDGSDIQCSLPDPRDAWRIEQRDDSQKKPGKPEPGQACYACDQERFSQQEPGQAIAGRAEGRTNGQFMNSLCGLCEKEVSSETATSRSIRAER
jgi:hypothetical protein